MVELAIFALEAVLPKLSADDSMHGALSNFCDGSSYAEIGS